MSEHDADADAQLPAAEESSKLLERGERLRQAVAKAGGVKLVAEAAAVPPGTISHYQLGREMKVSTLAALAQACGVSMDWIVTGASGPRMHVYAANETLFSTLNMVRLGECVRATIGSIGRLQPTDADIGRYVALAYDKYETMRPADLFDVVEKVAKE